jgi:hypothetical protein
LERPREFPAPSVNLPGADVTLVVLVEIFEPNEVSNVIINCCNPGVIALLVVEKVADESLIAI